MEWKKTSKRTMGNAYISYESKKGSWQKRSKGRAEETGEAEADTSQGPRAIGGVSSQRVICCRQRRLLSCCSLPRPPYPPTLPPTPSLELLLIPMVWRGLQKTSASLTPVCTSSAHPDYHFLINFLKPCFHLVISWLKTQAVAPSCLWKFCKLSLVFSLNYSGPIN